MKKLAIVTGGTRGIGRSITLKLIKLGFEVYFTYQSNSVLAHQLEEENPGQCKGFQFDSAHDDIHLLSKHILGEKSPTILINNVGINHDELFLNQSIENFWKIFELNFGSTVKFCKAFLEPMIQQRQGHIINISSVAAIKPKIGNSAYGASKAAIERFSKSLALEVARFNIHVNCVAPAYVETDLLNNFLEGQKQNDFYKAIPMRKVLAPDEVAETVISLCTNRITTTGSIFYIGNGENIVN